MELKYIIRETLPDSSSSSFDGCFGPVVSELSSFLFWPEHLKRASQVLLDPHHCSTIVELTTIIGS